MYIQITIHTSTKKKSNRCQHTFTSHLIVSSSAIQYLYEKKNYSKKKSQYYYQ